MHDMQTIVTDVRGVCLSRGLSRRRVQCVGVIRCSLCQITLACPVVLSATLNFAPHAVSQSTSTIMDISSMFD